MKLGRLVIRSLAFYWRTGFVVAFGVAVATAVIVGSLVIGDSVTGSVRETALVRLGRIHHAMSTAHFFRASLAADIERHLAPRNGVGAVTPVIITQGRALARRTKATVPQVRVVAVESSFWEFYAAGGVRELSGRSAAVSSALARDLSSRICREGKGLV